MRKSSSFINLSSLNNNKMRCINNKRYKIMWQEQQKDNEVMNFVTSLAEGIESCELKLIPISEGLGGSYFVVGPKNTHIAVFKPSNQEVGMSENLKGNAQSEKVGFTPGFGYLREAATYLMDHDHFAKVPLTGIVTILGEVGSLQQFIHSDGDGSYGFAKYITEDVHRIGILDIRLLNCDRHEANLLYVRDRDSDERQCCHVFPIDHGCVLPESGLQDLEFDWIYYTQSKQPFSQECLSYIKNLDAEKDAMALRVMGFCEEATDNVRAATLALQIAAKLEFTLRQIGEFVRRTQITQPSGLESAIAASRSHMNDLDSEDGGNIDWDLLQQYLVETLANEKEKFE